jgi:hypothetical protein
MTTPPRSLKDDNRWPLWLIIAANFATFYAVGQADAIWELGLKGLIVGAVNLLPVGLALVITSIANGQLTAETKSRLVFLRWRNALPGHRAFSIHGPDDPRVDMKAVKRAVGGALPHAPRKQNEVWFRLYKGIENDAAVKQAHREYLFARDYAAFSFLFLMVFAPATALIVDSWKVAALYAVLLLAQFLIVRRAASLYGISLVTTVLARAARTRR